MEYKKFFNDSWKELCEMARNGTFTPHQEQDIVCLMYHLCLEKMRDPNQIHASSGYNFDLILGNLKAEKRKDQKFSHCLIAEFKFILRKGRKNKRLKGAYNDMLKLSKQGDPTVGRVFALFDKTASVTSKEIDEMKKYKENVTVFFGRFK